MTRIGYAEVIGGATGSVANAGWFGDGRDEDLYVADGQTYVFDVALDEGQVVKQFKSVYIGVGATVKTSGRCNGMVWAVQGNFENHGTITMDKCAPLLNDQEERCAQEAHVRLLGGITGGNAGNAGNGYGDAASRARGIGGVGFALGGGFGAGSASNYMNGGNGDPRAPIGTILPYRDTNLSTGGRVLYGSGGNMREYQGVSNADGGYVTLYGGRGFGGSGACSAYRAYYSNASGKDGDAIGGGLIAIYVGGKCINESTGVITSCGGNGAEGVGAEAGSGSSYTRAATGGGSGAGGGIIAIVHNGDYTNRGSIRVDGGIGGAKHSYGGAAGEDGSAGTILVTTLDELLAA